MPGIFVEGRIKNFRCSWAENGEHWHPVGYLCSIGLARGVAINPNNGGTATEFFKGVSFGIQRFALLVGFHNGRYQQFGGGYFAGEIFPPGTTVTPPTTYGWATHSRFRHRLPDTAALRPSNGAPRGRTTAMWRSFSERLSPYPHPRVSASPRPRVSASP
jgi:hypothetical protein